MSDPQPTRAPASTRRRLQPTAAEQQRRSALRRMKAIATGLLVAAAIVYLIARASQDGDGSAATVWGYVRAGAEAAMVGALADWFAVTALFRHPLRLPIPHTAIIPHRKDQLGASLGEFVESNFMSREILDERLGSIGVGRRVGDWLSDDANAVRAAAALGDVARGALEVIDDRQVQEGLERVVQSRLREVRVTPLVGRAIELGVEGGHHQRLLDSVLRALHTLLDEHHLTLRNRLREESPWWVPDAIDDRIFAKIVDGVRRFLDDVATHPDHEIRATVQSRIEDFAQRLQTDPALIERGEQLKTELLDHPDVRGWIESLWDSTKQSLIDAAAQPDSELRRRVAATLQNIGERLLIDDELRASVDDWVARAAAYVVDTYRSEVSALIASTVSRWDGEQTADKIEQQVGRDLQFIRINGTIVGGLAGLVIHAISEGILG